MEGIVLYVREIWAGIMLLSGSIEDIRKRGFGRFFIVFMLAGTIAAICLSYSEIPDKNEILSALTGAGAGLLLLPMCRLSNGAIGEGDAVFIACIGMIFGISDCFQIFMYSLLFLAVFAVPAIASGKAGRHSSVPYIPFLAAGYALYIYIVYV